MPYKKSPMKKSSCIKMYDKKGKPSGLMMEGSAMHMESAGQDKKDLMKDMPIDKRAGSPAKQIDERSGEGVTVTGDASKVGVYGAQLDKAFQAIEDTLASGGYMGSQQQSEAGLGYGTVPSEQLSRLKQMREEKGAPETLRYMRGKSRSTVGSKGIPEYLSMPKQIKT
jgi:hypothetical protein